MSTGLPEGVKALRLFGSTARGEGDESSDIDILVVGSFRTEALEAALTARLPDYSAERLSFSWYGADKIRRIYHDGDLFAWHLYRESRPLVATADLLSSLGEPAAYQDGPATFATFRGLLVSSEHHIKADDTSPTYEAGLLYAASRNIAMALSWNTLLGLNFSRRAPFAVSEAVDLRFPLSREQYALLVNCRLKVQRGLPAEVPSRPCLLFACRSLIGWADALWNRTHT